MRHGTAAGGDALESGGGVILSVVEVLAADGLVIHGIGLPAEESLAPSAPCGGAQVSVEPRCARPDRKLGGRQLVTAGLIQEPLQFGVSP